METDTKRTPPTDSGSEQPKKLEECAQQAREAHRQAVDAEKLVVESGRKSIAAAIAAGEALKTAKGLLVHGKWTAWVGKFVPQMSKETAQRYMRLAESSHVTDLAECETLRQAYIATGILKEQEGAGKPPKTKSGGKAGKSTDSTEWDDDVGQGDEETTATADAAVRYVRKVLNEIPKIEVGSEEEERLAGTVVLLVEWYNGFLEAQRTRKREVPRDDEWMLEMREKFPVAA